MKMLIQRVLKADVTVEGSVIGKINKGFLVFLGVSNEDSKETAEKMVRKLLGLRIFEDENDKINLSLKDVGGEILVISQFTLYADCRRGNRPGFEQAGKADFANELYEYVLNLIEKETGSVEHGKFGADMKVSLLNDGPFTIWLDSDEIFKKRQEIISR